MSEEERTRRWQRIPRPAEDADPIQVMRACILEVRAAPTDPEARRRLRALVAAPGVAEQVALLIADEARAAQRADVAAAFYEELADIYDNSDQPLETIAAMEALVARVPDEVAHHDRLAWLYRRAGAWSKAAASFERVAELATDDRARAALRAAGKLYRDNARHDRAVDIYRKIVERKPSDLDAWRALEELLHELGRWRELAQVRGMLAKRVTGVEKAALLRSQARALEQAGDASAAVELVATAAEHAPEDVSGLVDYAVVLARRGKGEEAAQVLRDRLVEAFERNASAQDIAALRSRLAAILEDAVGDRPAAAAVLDELLADVPDYLPALERHVWHASHDPDPKVHAAALLRQAAAMPAGAERAAILQEAARRAREGGDLAMSLRALEDANDILRGNTLRFELEDARTALAVDRAARDMRSGELGEAVRRLRAILDEHPHHVAANLSLAELIPPAEAIEHLSATLASVPDGMPGTAKLVHRFALAHAAVGDADEAHQLLHEAHRLDRRDLVITLALGESCYARRLWREAAIHLGSLVEHPDAPRHAAEVATGLVHAALADVRGMRPANAEKRYEAAVRLDPKCAAAWHALGEAALSKGDMHRAAECLEREADATTAPADRLRLYDALGDLALDVMGDTSRAERCWMQVADVGDVDVLDKLLGLLRRRGARIERAEICERLAALSEDKRVKKELAEEAAQAFAAGGDLARARSAAERLIAAHPLDVDAVVCATAVAMTARDTERAAQWLRRALTTWETSGDRGEGDPRRADLWRRLGDAERARSDDRAALAAYQRAVAVAPESDGALAARRGLVGLATTAGRPAGESLAALVEADQVPVDVLAWARELARGDKHDDARAAFELARALGARPDKSDEQILASHPVRGMASDEAYAAPLDEAERRELVDDDADAPLADLLEMVWEAAPLLCPDARTALNNAGLQDARRVSAATEAAAARIYPQIANALGGAQTLVYAIARGQHPDLLLLLASPPVVVLGPKLVAMRAVTTAPADADSARDTELRFKLGRIVELARPRRILAASDSLEFGHLVGGLLHAFAGVPAADEVTAAEAERLRTKLPMLLRRRLADKLAGTRALDADAYVEACERAADRAGLIACGHAGVAIELAGGPERARHLVRLASSQRYLAARKKLRSRRVG